ncbi:MAG: coproporphyrinogen III oxidase, partial [Sulfurovaceae bacterium]
HYAQNTKDMKTYEAAIDSGKLPFERGLELSIDDLIRKAVIMELMANFSIDIKRVEDKFEIDFSDYFDDAMRELVAFSDADLIEITQEKIQANKTGAMLIRNIAMPFDAYMNKYKANKKSFSKTV